MQFAIRRPVGYGKREQSEKDPSRWYRGYVDDQGCTTCALSGQLGMRLRGLTSFVGCSIRAMPCTSMIWHRIFGGCQGERKTGASKSNQGASHRNKNRLASRRRRGMRIREGETRQNTRRKEGRPGLLFWMDGWRRSYMRPSGWMEPPRTATSPRRGFMLLPRFDS